MNKALAGRFLYDSCSTMGYHSTHTQHQEIKEGKKQDKTMTSPLCVLVVPCTPKCQMKAAANA